MLKVKSKHSLVLVLVLVLVLMLDPPVLALGKPRPAPGRTSVKRMAAKYGFPTPRTDKDKFILKSKYTQVTFHADSRKMLVNGMLIWLNGGAARGKRDWTVTAVDASRVVAPLLRPTDVTRPPKDRPIVIDPGHGGEDTGATVGRNVVEKHLVLDVAKKLLAAPPSRDVKLKLTRTGDAALTLEQRADLAKKWNAALFVSVHMNSAPNKAAQGIETYVLPAAGFPSTSGQSNKTEMAPGNKHDAASSLLAYCLHKQLLTHTKCADRGIRRARFDVLRDAPCPAILIECGFLSNAEERKRLLTKEYRKTIAKAIAAGLKEFLEKTKPAEEEKPGKKGAE